MPVDNLSATKSVRVHRRKDGSFGAKPLGARPGRYPDGEIIAVSGVPQTKPIDEVIRLLQGKPTPKGFKCEWADIAPPIARR